MKRSTLITGDILALLITTLIGFITHREGDLSFAFRFSAIYFPLSIAWFLLAPWFGLFQSETASNPKQLWRPVLSMLFAGPLAVVLRGLILNAPIIPIFAVVLSATSAFGMFVWRALYFFMNRQAREER
ncbi:MAG: DUF3054 family protein [Chloroflexota bacterium]